MQETEQSEQRWHERVTRDLELLSKASKATWMPTEDAVKALKEIQEGDLVQMVDSANTLISKWRG